MEFDERVAQPEFVERFYKYLELFELAGIWDADCLLHNNDAWTLIAESKDPAIHAPETVTCLTLGVLVSSR